MSSELVTQYAIQRIKQNAVENLPDGPRYKCRFKIKSASSNSLYMVSFDTAGPYWTCSCPGNIRHGSCKHLNAMGLKGRAYGNQLAENQEWLRRLI